MLQGILPSRGSSSLLADFDPEKTGQLKRGSQSIESIDACPRSSFIPAGNCTHRPRKYRADIRQSERSRHLSRDRGNSILDSDKTPPPSGSDSGRDPTSLRVGEKDRPLSIRRQRSVKPGMARASLDRMLDHPNPRRSSSADHESQAHLRMVPTLSMRIFRCTSPTTNEPLEANKMFGLGLGSLGGFYYPPFIGLAFPDFAIHRDYPSRALPRSLESGVRTRRIRRFRFFCRYDRLRRSQARTTRSGRSSRVRPKTMTGQRAGRTRSMPTNMTASAKRSERSLRRESFGGGAASSTLAPREQSRAGRLQTPPRPSLPPPMPSTLSKARRLPPRSSFRLAT